MGGDAHSLCHRCNRMGHVARDCTIKTCFRCSGRGHMAWECTVGVVCSGCGETGHLQRNCRNVSCHRCQRKGHIAKFCTDPFARAAELERMERQQAMMAARAAQHERWASQHSVVRHEPFGVKGPPSAWDGLGGHVSRRPPVFVLRAAGSTQGAAEKSTAAAAPGAAALQATVSGRAGAGDSLAGAAREHGQRKRGASEAMDGGKGQEPVRREAKSLREGEGKPALQGRLPDSNQGSAVGMNALAGIVGYGSDEDDEDDEVGDDDHGAGGKRGGGMEEANVTQETRDERDSKGQRAEATGSGEGSQIVEARLRQEASSSNLSQVPRDNAAAAAPAPSAPEAETEAAPDAETKAAPVPAQAAAPPPPPEADIAAPAPEVAATVGERSKGAELVEGRSDDGHGCPGDEKQHQQENDREQAG